MKKQLLFLTLLLLPILARGYDACINDIYYNLDNSTMEASVTYSYQRYSPTYSYKGSIKIPEIVLNNGKEYRVTSIGETAFWTCTGLTSLTLPKSIKKIDMQAFDGCINLTAVHISDLAAWCQINFGLDEGNNPLWFAHHLYLDDKEIIDLCIPDNITYVNSYAFSVGSSITSVSIPNSVTGIGTSAFSGCSSMTSISIPNNITVIESEAFQDCSSLTTVTIPNSVTIIGFGAFNGCNGLKTLIIEDSDKALSVVCRGENNGLHLFHGAPIETLYWGRNIVNIDNNESHFYSPFAHNNSLKNLTISENVTLFPDNAFLGCSTLTSVTIPNRVTIINDNAFWGCSSLTSVTIPNSVTTIGKRAFLNCSSLTSVIISNSITIICDEAFAGCSNLTSMTMSNNISSIGDRAFNNTLIETFDMPASIHSLGENIFDNCKALHTILYWNDTPPTNWVATTHTYVPNKNTYSTPSYNINSAQIIPMIEWDCSEFDYNGATPIVNWKNNLNDYSCDFDESLLNNLEKNSGTWESVMPFSFTKGGVSHTINCSYNYTINKVPLLASVKNASRVFGDDNPEFDITYNGFVNNEDASVITILPTITTTARKTSRVGEYPISANGGEALNYLFNYEEGILSVLPANLSVTVNDETRVYGDENPTFTLSYSGLKNNETKPAWITQPIFTTDASTQSDVGTYEISVTAEPRNYTITSNQAGKLTITPAPLTIKADNATRQYFDDEPEYTFTCEGFKNADDESVLTKKPTFIPDATQSSGVGTYPLNVSGAEAKNYDITYIPATLSITPRMLNITATNMSRLYGYPNPTFELTYDGFVNGENEKVLASIPVVTTVATEDSPVGDYDIKIGETTSQNYSITYNDGTLSINPRTLIASVGNYERAYNEDNPVFVIQYDGFYKDEDETVFAEKPTAITLATKETDAGIYAISVIGGEAQNYKFSYVSGLLTINKAEQTLTWEQDLSNLKIGDRVKLTAVASSGLPITYQLDETRAAEIDTESDIVYLNCQRRGRFSIIATQEGNNNYNSAPQISKNVTISEEEVKDYIATLSDAGYATFYDSFYDYKLPSGLKASVITQATDTRLTYKVIAEGDRGGIVPAGVAVLLQGKERRADTYTLTPKESTTSYTGPNLLHGSDDPTTTTADGNCLFYKLAYGPSGTALSNTLGWFWGANNGRPFDIEGHKAWLAIPQTSAAKPRALFYSIEGDALDIEGLPLIPSQGEDTPSGEWYDLQGRRVENPTQRGIYIRDGKKVMVK